jgi:CHAT domain-containing protein
VPPTTSLTLDEIVASLLGLDDDDERRRLLRAALDGADQDALLQHLRAEAERYRQIDTKASLRLAGGVIDGARMAGRREHEALGMMAKADALWLLGQYATAVDLYEEARRSFLDRQHEVGWARTHIGWVIACYYVGRGEEALAAVTSARETLVRHEEWMRAAGVDINAGYVCWRLGRYSEALERYERALGVLKTHVADSPLKATHTASILGNKANVLTLLGEFDAALAEHAASRRIFAELGESVSALRVDQFMADLHAAQGDYTRALALYGEALTGLERAELSMDAAWVALSMTECYLSLNRPTDALAMAEETVERFERYGSPTEVARARFACAMAQARLGDRDAALRTLDQSAEAFTVTGHRSHLATVELQRASLALLAEDWSGAHDAATRAHDLFAEQRLVVRRLQADFARARALLGLARHREAEELVRASLEAIHERDLVWLAHEANHLLAVLACEEGDYERALAACQAAIESIDRVQGRLAVELRGYFLEDKLQVYHDAIKCSLRLGRPDLAFGYLESGKSRALVDYLVSNPGIQAATDDPDDRTLAEELSRLRAEHGWLYDRLHGDGLTRRPDEARDDDGAAVEATQAALRRRERQIARLLERRSLRRSAGPEAFASRAAPTRAAPPSLDERSALLEFFLHEDGGTVFVVTASGLTTVPLTTSAGEIRRLVHLWQLNLDATTRALAAGEALTVLARNARGVLTALHRALLAPVAALAADRERLIVVPYGPAHAVPFHALHDGRRYLLEAHEVTVCPSSSLWRLARDRPRRARGDALILAHSHGGRLPCVFEEVQSIAAEMPATVLIEEQATRAALIEAAPAHRIVHLAAHGEARLDDPTFAHLALADGQLYTADIFNLDLRGALVVLSACETGRSVVAGGDELIGLSRGFLHAGASTLVQSLWRVEDRSTARLMAGFYAALKHGASTAAALRRAQRDLLEDGIGDGHPYYWAPFQLIGDGGPL